MPQKYTKYNSIKEILDAMQERDSTALMWEEDGAVKKCSARELAQTVKDKSQDLPGYTDAVVWDGKSTTVERILADIYAGRDLLLAGKNVIPESVDGAASSLEQRQSAYFKTQSAVSMFTTGTTGKPKAVILTQKGIAYSLWSGQTILPCTPEDIILAEIPISHIYGFVASLMWGLTYGATVALGRGPEHIREDMELFRPTILPATPPMIEGIAADRAFNPELKTLIIGGYFLEDKLLEDLRAWGGRFHVGYGMTETACQIAISMDQDDPFKLTPFPGMDIRIESDGEISVETPSLMEGYLGEPPLMEPVFRTGDLGEIDEQGRLILKGRK